MLELLSDPNAWASLLTLTALEIVLGIDNLIFLSIVSGRLPVAQQARRAGSGWRWPLVTRIGLLCSHHLDHGPDPAGLHGRRLRRRAWRDIVLGLRRPVPARARARSKSTTCSRATEQEAQAGTATFFGAVVQIILLDIVFSLDSVITAVGMADHLQVMIAAVVIADRGHAGRGRPGRRLRQPPPDGEDAGAVVPAPGRRGADRRRASTSTSRAATSTSRSPSRPWSRRSTCGGRGPATAARGRQPPAARLSGAARYAVARSEP